MYRNLLVNDEIYQKRSFFGSKFKIYLILDVQCVAVTYRSTFNSFLSKFHVLGSLLIRFFL